MFNNWALCDGSMLSSCSFSFDAISPCKDVLESFVLESVRIYINHSGVISNTRINKCSLRYRVRVDVSHLERLFLSFTSVNIFKGSDLEAISILMYLDHFPTEMDLDSTFVTFIQCNSVGI